MTCLPNLLNIGFIALGHDVMWPIFCLHIRFGEVLSYDAQYSELNSAYKYDDTDG